MNQAMLGRSRGEHTAVLENILKVTQLAPENPTGWFLLGMMQEEMGYLIGMLMILAKTNLLKI